MKLVNYHDYQAYIFRHIPSNSLSKCDIVKHCKVHKNLLFFI